MTITSIDREEIRALAHEFSLELDDETIETCLERIADLDIEPASEPRTDSVGRRSDDPYNALLDTYETPRSKGIDGPLDGVSVALKDNFAVKDLELTCGFREFSFVPREDAVVVERLLDAGASVVGKANMDALAVGPGGVWSEHGQVTNPRYEGLVPGGSSSGSGAAVAAGLVDAALGSDTGGSVRKPAAYCRLVGVKPTSELVPRHGLVPLAPSMDAIGTLTRDVGTAARVLDAIAGPDPRDPSASRVPIGSVADGLDDHPAVTVGLPDSFFDPAIEEVDDRVRAVVDRLVKRYDVEVRPVDLDVDGLPAVYSAISGGEFAWLLGSGGVMHGTGTWYDEEWHAAFGRLLERGFNDHVVAQKFPGGLVDVVTNGRSYLRARTAAIEFERRLNDAFESVDVLLSPTIPSFPPEVGTDLSETGHDQSVNLRPFNLARTPAVAVPAGEVDDRPVSVQVAAPAFEDARALSVARMIETLVD